MYSTSPSRPWDCRHSRGWSCGMGWGERRICSYYDGAVSKLMLCPIKELPHVWSDKLRDYAVPCRPRLLRAVPCELGVQQLPRTLNTQYKIEQSGLSYCSGVQHLDSPPPSPHLFSGMGSQWAHSLSVILNKAVLMKWNFRQYFFKTFYIQGTLYTSTYLKDSTVLSDTLRLVFLLDSLSDLGLRAAMFTAVPLLPVGQVQENCAGGLFFSTLGTEILSPIGLMLSRVLIKIYSKQLGKVIRRLRLWCHQYAWETHHYLKLPSDPWKVVERLGDEDE